MRLELLVRGSEARKEESRTGSAKWTKEASTKLQNLRSINAHEDKGLEIVSRLGARTIWHWPPRTTPVLSSGGNEVELRHLEPVSTCRER